MVLDQLLSSPCPKAKTFPCSRVESSPSSVWDDSTIGLHRELGKAQQPSLPMPRAQFHPLLLPQPVICCVHLDGLLPWVQPAAMRRKKYDGSWWVGMKPELCFQRVCGCRGRSTCNLTATWVRPICLQVMCCSRS